MFSLINSSFYNNSWCKQKQLFRFLNKDSSSFHYYVIDIHNVTSQCVMFKLWKWDVLYLHMVQRKVCEDIPWHFKEEQFTAIYHHTVKTRHLIFSHCEKNNDLCFHTLKKKLPVRTRLNFTYGNVTIVYIFRYSNLLSFLF